MREINNEKRTKDEIKEGDKRKSLEILRDENIDIIYELFELLQKLKKNKK
jgi:hypothetical protein